MKAPRLQFSLRLLLLAMLVLGLGLGYLTQRAAHNRAQRQQLERVWRIGGAVVQDGGKYFELPVFPDEWQLEAGKSWSYDAFVDCRPVYIIFPNHTGIRNKTSDADLDELIDAVRHMPTVKRIELTRMFHTDAGVAKLQRELPEVQVSMDRP